MVSASLAEEISNVQPIYDNQFAQGLQKRAEELNERLDRLEKAQDELQTSMTARLEFLRTELTRLHERQAVWASTVDDEDWDEHQTQSEGPNTEMKAFDQDAFEDVKTTDENNETMQTCLDIMAEDSTPTRISKRKQED